MMFVMSIRHLRVFRRNCHYSWVFTVGAPLVGARVCDVLRIRALTRGAPTYFTCFFVLSLLWGC
jgi:hypothetical protein